MRTNVSPAEGDRTFTAIAKDSYGRMDTNSITVNLPLTNSFAYDLNGNLLTNGTRYFEYDDENELIRITQPTAWKSEFSYDGKLRRRIEKNFTWQSSAWVQTNEIRFVYDGNVVLQEREANNLPQITLTRGKDLSGSLQGAGGIGGLLALTENPLVLNNQPATVLYHSDGNGNVTALVNTNQVVVGRYSYDPFGNTISIAGPKAWLNHYRFSSKSIHESSGMYDFLYRWYAPELQRWLSLDPIGDLGNNLYGFVVNDTVNKLDPDGRDTWVPYPPPGHYVSDPAPQRPQYPQGFAMCQRDVAEEGKSDSVGKCCNAFGGQHTFLQYVSRPQPPDQGPPFVWGRGFSTGIRTAAEGHFEATSCKTCTKNGSVLKYGSGAGKASASASDEEVRDCIINRQPTRRYSFPKYVCSDWAKEAVADCGLTCK